jgi:pimeloyl-ACP methyl ester carboxylesterase
MPHVTLNGTKYYYYAGKSGGKSGGPALVFLHGAGGNHRHWLQQAARLSQRCQTLALDLPGHGLSRGRARSQIEDYTDFVHSFTRQVLDRPFVLAGHSMGGAIAMDFALRYPEQLTGLILVTTGARLRVAPAMLEAFGSGRRTTRLIDLAYHGQTAPELLSLARQEMENTDPAIYFADFTACDKFNLMPELGKIQTPTLVVGAGEDRLTPAKYSVFLAEGIPGAHVEIIPSAGHMVMLEKPDQLNEAIIKFMEKIKED